MAKTNRVGRGGQDQLRVGKTTGVVELKQEVPTADDIDGPDVPVQKSEKPFEDFLNAEPISINHSPLLSDEISIMSHAGAGADNFKISDDLFAETKPPVTSEEKPPAPKFEYPEDAPEMKQAGPTPSPDGDAKGNPSSSGSLNPEVKAAIDNSMADMICDLYKDGVPELTFTWTRIREDKIKTLKNEGLIEQPLVDSVSELNKSIKKQLKDRGASDAKLLHGPLTRVLNEKQIKTTPMGDLMITLCFIALMNFLLIKELKGETTALMNAIMQKIDEKEAAKTKEV